METTGSVGTPGTSFTGTPTLESTCLKRRVSTSLCVCYLRVSRKWTSLPGRRRSWVRSETGARDGLPRSLARGSVGGGPQAFREGPLRLRTAAGPTSVPNPPPRRRRAGPGRPTRSSPTAGARGARGARRGDGDLGADGWRAGPSAAGVVYRSGRAAGAGCGRGPPLDFDGDGATEAVGGGRRPDAGNRRPLASAPPTAPGPPGVLTVNAGPAGVRNRGGLPPRPDGRALSSTRSGLPPSPTRVGFRWCGHCIMPGPDNVILYNKNFCRKRENKLRVQGTGSRNVRR